MQTDDTRSPLGMSNSNANHIDRIEFNPENDSAADVVDSMLKSICIGQLELATEMVDDDPEAALMAAAVAIEIDSRIEASMNIDLPSHIEPSDAFKDGVVEETVDDVLQDYADDLYSSANRMAGDNREHLLEVVGEFDGRIGGGH